MNSKWEKDCNPIAEIRYAIDKISNPVAFSKSLCALEKMKMNEMEGDKIGLYDCVYSKV